MFDYKEYFSDLSCYEEFCLKCDLLGKNKSDKKILNCLDNNENYYYFIDNNGEVIWLDDKGNKVKNLKITKIKDNAFYSCNSFESINIPNSVKYIGYNVFYNCKSLKSITIPNSVKYIGYCTFSWCKSLTLIVIPDSVKKN